MANPKIIVRHATQNNLKDVSLDLPKNKLVVFVGVSGSGKSSLVFDTIAAEAQRQLYDMFPLYVRNRLPQYDAPHVEELDYLSPVVVIQQRAIARDIRSTVGTMTDISMLLRLLFSRCAEPRLESSGMYSFNDPRGMCKCCSGLGKTITFDYSKLLDIDKSLNEGAIQFPGHKIGSYQWQLYANSGLLDPDKPLREYTEKEWHDFMHGEGVKVDIVNTTGKVWDKSYKLTYEGFLDRITRLYLKKDIQSQSKTNQKIIQQFTKESICPECGGARLNKTARSARLLGKGIADVGRMEIHELKEFLSNIHDPVATVLVKKMQHILTSIEEMGLGYLNLDRVSTTLSAGEAQRLKMVRHLESNLTGLIYIFDEPTAGLHPKDVERLSRLFLHLRNRGNTVYVVEHNKEIIKIADQIVEMGPQAGRNGGNIVFQGTLQELMRADTVTAKSLRREIQLTEPRRTGEGFLYIRDANKNNLQHVDAKIPCRALTVVTGVAGSGKSSLICGDFLQQHPEAIHISQAPIGKTPRSNPATYTGIMNDIRRIFAKENHCEASLFSSNAKGACACCGGRGIVKTEMAFMDAVEMKCEACDGTGYNPTVLAYTLHGKNIVEILRMTVNQAVEFFEDKKILQKLRILQRVGVGYLTLGQPVNTLSGGESQRIKLASYLDDRNGIYVMDEPTTGLHPEDIKQLMRLIHEMVDMGDTVILIEHNMEIAAQADWVIDMGPEGGKNGGQLVFQGTPDQLLQCKKSHTAAYLLR